MPKPRGKLGKLVIDNLVLLVGIPLIIGIHWGWASLQDDPHLLDPSEKRDLPILSAIRAFKYKLTGEGNPTSEKAE